MRRHSPLGPPLALVLAASIAGGQQPPAPGSAGRAYKVAFWFEARHPTTSIQYHVYDLARGEYDAAAVDRWLDTILRDYPDHGAYVRDIRTDGVPGATEAERLARAIEDEKRRWAALQRTSFSPAPRYVIDITSPPPRSGNAGRSMLDGRPPGSPGGPLGPSTSPFPYPYRSGPR